MTKTRDSVDCYNVMILLTNAHKAARRAFEATTEPEREAALVEAAQITERALTFIRTGTPIET